MLGPPCFLSVIRFPPPIKHRCLWLDLNRAVGRMPDGSQHRGQIILFKGCLGVLGKPFGGQTVGSDSSSAMSVDFGLDLDDQVRQIGHAGDSVAKRKPGLHVDSEKVDLMNTKGHRRFRSEEIRIAPIAMR